jgi:thiamine pyrophosphate-dependent acetolactate synthase large subunit-like protein
MRTLLNDYYTGTLSRRGFLGGLVAAGFTAAAAARVVEAADLGDVQAIDSSATSITGTGGDLLITQAKAAGARFVFTNPGSIEVGFFDALTDHDDLKVILGLHEGIVIPMADGYHRVSLKTAFVNVHSTGGTAQMAGQLANAHYDGSALVITSGLNDTTLFSDEGPISPNRGWSQSDVNRMFTKISWDVRNPASVALAVRRAFKLAATAPGGPVYIACTGQALNTKGVTADIYPRENFLVEARPRPAKDQIETLARWMIEAERPIPIFGDQVWKSGAQDDIIELCELLGLPAAGPGLGQGYRNFPTRHPHYIGTYSPAAAYPHGQADLVVQYGTRDWGGTNIPSESRLAKGAKFAAVGIDSNALGRTQAMNLAIVADVKAATRDLIEAIQSMATADRLTKIRNARAPIVKGAVASTHKKLMETVKANYGKSPMHHDELSYEMEQLLDRDAIIVVENETSPGSQTAPGTTLFTAGHRKDEKMWVTNTYLSLGWGIGAAIGAKLAEPNRQVVCSIGDGAVMFSASGFWTMKRYQIPVLTVVFNNYYYQAVRNGFYAYNGRMKETGHYHGLYIGDPEIDFVKLADSQGVKGEKVTAGSDIKAAFKRGIQATRDGNPYLIEVVVARTGGGADSTWHQGYKLAPERTRMV